MALRRFTADSSAWATPAATLPAHTWGVQDLDAEDAGVRREAVWMAQPSDALAQAICDRLTNEQDSSVLEAMFVALSRCQATVVVPAMFELLSSEEVLLRTRALEVLEAYPQEVAALMLEHLTQAEPDVRIFLVNLMVGLQHADVLQWLGHVLAHDTHNNVIAAALDVALEVAGPSLKAAVQLAKQRFTADPFIAFAADLVLQRIESQ